MPSSLSEISAPSIVKALISTTPMTSTRSPMFRMRRQPSSRPMPKSSSTSPSSASASITSRLPMIGVGSVYGPTISPATR